MPQITVYFPPDGSVVIRWPQGFTPDRDSLEHVAQAIAEHKKTPAPCGNMERGEQAISPAEQEDCTTETVSRQELGEAMEIVSQLPQEDVEELTEIARNIIKGRA